jgi:hypothetical protein
MRAQGRAETKYIFYHGYAYLFYSVSSGPVRSIKNLLQQICGSRSGLIWNFYGRAYADLEMIISDSDSITHSFGTMVNISRTKNYYVEFVPPLLGGAGLWRLFHR